LRHFESLGPDRVIALAYAPLAFRSDFEALLLLDTALTNAVRAAREPMLARIRLAWWRDRLSVDEAADVSADPALRAIRLTIARHDVIRGHLEAMVNGWEILLEEWPLSEITLDAYARERGESLFLAAAECAGIAPDAAIRACGARWALADLACRCSDAVTAERARAGANKPLPRLDKALRPFSLLAGFARNDLSRDPLRRIPPGSPRRLLQAIGIVYFRR
jgi:15-cis-phytoene synthase